MKTLIHPDLPGQPIDVEDAAVPIYKASGWKTPPSKAAAEQPLPRAAAKRAKAHPNPPVGHGGGDPANTPEGE